MPTKILENITQKIFVGVISALGVALLLLLAGYIAKIPSRILIPKGAIVAFNSETCPEGDTWVVFRHGEGQFLRGIDTSTPKRDKNYRLPGSIQPYSTAAPKNGLRLVESGQHSHRVLAETDASRAAGDSDDNTNTMASQWGTKGTEVNTNEQGNHRHDFSGWDTETRPTNVAVIFCEKK